MDYEFKAQLARVKRFLDRLEKKDRDRTEYEDDLWSFLQNCWHLKDWIKNDPLVPASVSSTVENDLKAFESLMICADLANRSKHLKLTLIRKDASVSGREIVVVVKERVGATDPSETQTSISWDYTISLADGTERRALQVARQAIKDWETLITKWQL